MYQKFEKLIKDKKYFKVRLAVCIICFLIIFTAIYFLFLEKALDTFENYTYDVRVALKDQLNPEKPDPDIIPVVFDDSTMKFIDEHPELGLGRWPLPRKVMGEINNYFVRANSSVTVFDILFNNSTDAVNDNYLVNSLGKSNNTYIAYVSHDFSYLKKRDFINNLKHMNEYIEKYYKFQKSEINYLNFIQSISKYFKYLNIDEKTINQNLFVNTTGRDSVLPYGKFLKSVKGIGSVNIVQQNNSITKSFPLFTRFKGKNIIPSLSLAAVLEKLPANQTTLALKGNNFYIGKKEIPITDHGEFYINWRNFHSEYENQINFTRIYIYEKFYTIDKRTGYRILPEEENYFMQPPYQYLYQRVQNLENFYVDMVFCSVYSKYINLFDLYNNQNQPFEESLKEKYFKVKKVLEDLDKLATANTDYLNYNKNLWKMSKYADCAFNPFYLTNKVVIIGECKSGSDVHNTPLGLWGGLYILANQIDNLLNDDVFIHKSPLWLDLILFSFPVFWSLLIVKHLKNKYTMIYAFLSLIIFYLLISILLFNIFLLWIPIVTPLFILIVLFIFALVTTKLLTEEKLTETYKLATTDGLTGLYNHRYFQEKISSKIIDVKRKEDSFSLLLIDIDFFKKFNDTYGHRAGDAVLIQVGKTLNSNVRDHDIVCRYGGEEMCVILDKTVTPEAIEIANKLVKSIAETSFNIPSEGQSKTVNVTISIGIANYPEHGKTVPELIEFADQGLYRAKEGGRNRVGEIEDVLAESDKPVVSKELEISKAKIKKEFEKILPICAKNNINFDELIQNLSQESQNKEKQ